VNQLGRRSELREVRDVIVELPFKGLPLGIERGGDFSIPGDTRAIAKLAVTVA
jgi:hypothetical protein